MKKIKFIKLFLSDLGVSLPKGEYPSIFHYCITFTLLLFLFSTTIFEVYAQSGRAKSLELGNRWIYELYDGSLGEYSYVYYTVIGDTLIDEKIYVIIKRTRSNSSYSNHLYQRANDTIIYSYSSQLQGDEIIIDLV